VDKKTFICGFVSDQAAKPWKALHWAKFMDHRVPMHTGAEMLAKRLDLAVVFFSVKRLKRGYYETTFETITETPKEFKDYEITDIFFRLVEKQIYEAPEYYLWTHKRWKNKDNSPEDYDKVKA
jgi:KDO2-lipid IV(A) lauroyltransferase